MENEPIAPLPDAAAADPEIAALLAFPPVLRKNKRHDGWTPAHQRGFVAWLAVAGNVDKAAQAVGRTQSGAWTVRNSAGAEGFADAWEAALALFHARLRTDRVEVLRAPPAGPRHTPRHARELREARAFGRGAPFAAGDGEPELNEAEKKELLDEILQRYLVKLRAERQARLAGRIVEADYYVRQLTFIELILDVGGRTQELLALMRQGDLHVTQISATPGSTLLEKLRRFIWLEQGEADRPPPAPLGRHNEAFATGSDEYDPERDGDRAAWERAQAERRRLAAEAQAEWEARARAEAPLVIPATLKGGRCPPSPSSAWEAERPSNGTHEHGAGGPNPPNVTPGSTRSPSTSTDDPRQRPGTPWNGNAPPCPEET